MSSGTAPAALHCPRHQQRHGPQGDLLLQLALMDRLSGALPCSGYSDVAMLPTHAASCLLLQQKQAVDSQALHSVPLLLRYAACFFAGALVRRLPTL